MPFYNNKSWEPLLFEKLKAYRVTIFSYVPDAGHQFLINSSINDNSIFSIPLTSEQEGVGISFGAYLGGKRSVLLMQSSGVGNCVNQFSLIRNGNFPFLTIVSMRGEKGENNPWQIPMGEAVKPVLDAMKIKSLLIDSETNFNKNLDKVFNDVFRNGKAWAIMLSQSLLGFKKFK